MDKRVKVKVKAGEKLVKYLDLAWELRKLWNMNVTVIPVVAIETVHPKMEKRLDKLEIIRRNETIQTTALQNHQGFVEESWRSWETCCHSEFTVNYLLNLVWKTHKKHNKTRKIIWDFEKQTDYLKNWRNRESEEEPRLCIVKIR